MQAPETPSDCIRAKLFPPKDVSTTMRIKALVGSRGAKVFHVFEFEKTLPKFAMYVSQDVDSLAQPESSVTFQVGRLTNSTPALLLLV